MLTASDIEAFSEDMENEQRAMIQRLLALQAALNYFITANSISTARLNERTTSMATDQMENMLKQTMIMVGVPSELRHSVINIFNNSHKALLPKLFINQKKSVSDQSATLLKVS